MCCTTQQDFLSLSFFSAPPTLIKAEGKVCEESRRTRKIFFWQPPACEGRRFQKFSMKVIKRSLGPSDNERRRRRRRSLCSRRPGVLGSTFLVALNLVPNQQGCNAQWKLSRDMQSANGLCTFSAKSYAQSALINNHYSTLSVLIYTFRSILE